MHLELIQNICIICLEPDDLKVYNEKFGCDCPCFFHDDCWRLFAVGDYKCPLCRKPNIENEGKNRIQERFNRIKYFFLYLEFIIFNIFLLLLIQVYMDLMFVLFLIICGLSCAITVLLMVQKQSRKYIYIYTFVNLFFSFFSIISMQTELFDSHTVILSFQITRIFCGLILALMTPYLYY